MANKALLRLDFLVLYLITVRVVAEPCGGHLDGSAIIAILSETYPRCRDLDLSLRSLVCEIGNDDIGSTQYGSTYIPAGLSACPDNTFDKVCYPELHSDCRVYNCVCRSFVNKGIEVSGGNWTDWAPLNNPVKGMNYFRSFLMDEERCSVQEFSQVEVQSTSTVGAATDHTSQEPVTGDAATESADISPESVTDDAETEAADIPPESVTDDAATEAAGISPESVTDYAATEAADISPESVTDDPETVSAIS